MSSMPPPPPPGGDQYGQQNGQQYGHQPAPQYHGGQGPQAPMSGPPKSMVFAKYAMWAGAAVSLIGLVPALFMRDQMREIAEESLRESGASYDQSQVDLAVNMGLGLGLFMGVLGAALWVLMAVLTAKGMGWARIVATVLYVIYVVSFLCGLAQPNPPVTIAVNVLVLIIGGVATFFLWQKDSSAWFKAHKAPTV